MNIQFFLLKPIKTATNADTKFKSDEIKLGTRTLTFVCNHNGNSTLHVSVVVMVAG